jgi:histidyl-tRNA synthetase
VWRAERPQRGRYRELYQCDADIAGVASMSADAEIIGVVVTALKRLGLPQFMVKINNRKLVTAIGQYSGVPDEQLGDLYRSIDKFDKIGADGVREELRRRGLGDEVIARMMELVLAHEPGLTNLDMLEQALGTLPAAEEGIRELRELADHLGAASITQEDYAIDFTMVRGLGYYTGPIFETVIEEPNLGSVSGGGRYDDLIGLFRRDSVPTTGTSLGIERIIDVMDILDLYPAHINGTVVQVYVTVFDDATRPEATRLAAELRAQGLRTELHLEDRKLGRQLQHADRKGIPLVAILGSEEIAQGIVKVKRLRDGQEFAVARAAAAERIQALLG